MSIQLRRFIYITTHLFLTTFSFGQVIQRDENETAEKFVSRLKPGNAEMTHKVIEANWNKKPVIIAFYNQVYKSSPVNDPDQQTYQRIIVSLFIQADSNHYNKYLIDTIENEGGDPKIEAIFFANADNDLEKEIVLIVSWEQNHRAVWGTLYNTRVYDNILKSTELNPLNDVSEKLDGGCECGWPDGKRRKAKFKTAADIKKGLTQLGYKQ